MTAEELRGVKFVKLNEKIIEIQNIIGDFEDSGFFVYYIDAAGPNEGSGFYMRSCLNTEIEEIIKEEDYPEYFL